MAEKLSVEIALEGGKEIERQLADIGTAGQKAFADIEKAATEVGGFKNLKPEEVTAKLKAAGLAGTEAFGKIQTAVANAGRFEKVVLGLQAVENGFAAVGRAAGALSAAAGPVLLVVAAAVVLAAKATVKFAEEITKLNAEAMNLGLTIEQFDRLRQGLEKAGLSVKAITSGVEQFKGSLDKIDADRVTQAAQAFKQLQEAGDPQGTKQRLALQLQILQQAALGTGEAAKLARDALVQLGAVAPDVDKVSAAMARLGITSTDISVALPQFVEKLRQMPDGAQRSALAIEQFGKVAGPELIQALQTGGVAVDQFVQKQAGLTQATVDSAAKVEQSTNKALAATERFAQVEIAPTLMDGWNALIRKVQEYLALFEKATTPAPSGGAPGGAAGGQVTRSGVGGSAGFAGGGLLGGRGSGTSDSNLVRVSRGEHIMPARVVRQPGVLELLEALRRSGGNLRRVIDSMGRFNLGGLAPVRTPLAIPAFAGGGGAHRDLGHLTLHLPDGSMVSGLTDQKIVEALRRTAALGQVRSGGRKPSRY